MQARKTSLILTVFFLYAIVYVVIEDVLQAEVYHFHIRILGYVIVFGVLSYLFARRAFKDHFRYLRDTQILLLMLSSLVFAYGVQFAIHERIEKVEHEEKVFPNPLYPKYEAMAKKYDLDLAFTKNTIEKRGPINYRINTIYTKRPKSIDILFIGDSNIAWGLIPEVIEQITGKKVAVFAYESNAITKKTAELFDRISKYYLKDDGVLVLSFDNHLYKKNPNTVLISKKEYEEMVSWDSAQFVAFAKSREGKTDHTVSVDDRAPNEKKEANTVEDLQKDHSSFNQYQKKYRELSDYLGERLHLRLKSVDLYTLYLEEYINPEWNKNKNVNIKNDTTMYLRWNMNTITLYDPNFGHYSIHSESMPSKEPADKNIEANAKAAAEIFGPKKIFMVPLFDKEKHYELSRSIYYTYYRKEGFELCDLGLEHPKNAKYPMEGGSHMVNEGGLLKSILVGHCLKEKLKH